MPRNATQSANESEIKRCNISIMDGCHGDSEHLLNSLGFWKEKKTILLYAPSKTAALEGLME